jgi:hypothetical protein
MTDHLDEKTRTQIAQFLPTALSLAMTSYEDFLTSKSDLSDSKEFKAHHDACKVALAHVAFLLKLTHSLAGDVEDDDFTIQMSRAHSELEKLSTHTEIRDDTQ